MIFHPTLGSGKAVQEKSGTFSTANYTTVDIGFNADAVLVTEGASGKDYSGADVLIEAGCVFSEASRNTLMTSMHTTINNAPHFCTVYINRNGNNLTFSFVMHDPANIQNTVTSPTKTYYYHAVKYS